MLLENCPPCLSHENENTEPGNLFPFLLTEQSVFMETARYDKHVPYKTNSELPFQRRLWCGHISTRARTDSKKPWRIKWHFRAIPM